MSPLTTEGEVARVIVPPGGESAVLTLSATLPDTLGITDTDPLYRAQLYLQRPDGGDAVNVTRATLRVTHHPNDGVQPQPRIVRAS